MRMSRTALLPIAVLAICLLPVAAATPWLLLLQLVPVTLVAWVFRVGDRGDLWLVTTAGTQVRLPVLRARDLPRLAQLSGGRIPAP